MQSLLSRLPGLLSLSLLAIASYAVVSVPVIAGLGISSMVVAIVVGIALGNILPVPTTLIPGIQFAAKRLLRLAIVLYGFRITLQEIAAVGSHAIIIDALVVSTTLVLGYFAATRILKQDSDLSLLISAGAAICGAAAVLAVEDVIKSEPYKASVAIGTVVLFGTLSMFLYPALQKLGWLGIPDSQFGLFAGASVHEVAQALVTGSQLGPEVGKTAVVVKMIRVLMLVPVLMILGVWKSGPRRSISAMVPWFAVLFSLVICFNSLHWLPESVVAGINQFDILLLTMAMGAIGLETRFSKIKQVGLTPLYQASGLFIWLCGFTIWLI